MISVCIPVWNVEKTIAATIQSVLNQSLNDFEIIVVDDRGSDDSIAIVKGFQNQPQGDKIRIIQHDENRSLGTVRNTCIENALGEYIIFLDGDDLLMPDCLQILLHEIETDEYDFVVGSVECRYEDQSIARELEAFNKYRLKKIELNTHKEIVNYALLQGGIYIPVWNKLYRRSFLVDNRIRAIDGIFTEDEFFSFQVFLKSNKCKLIEKITYIHYKRRVKITNKTREHCIKKTQDYITIANMERQYIRGFEDDPLYWDIAWRLVLLHKGEFAKRLQSQNYVEYVPGPVIRFLKKNPIPYRQRIKYPTRYICFLTKYIQSCLFPDKYRIVIPRINP